MEHDINTLIFAFDIETRGKSPIRNGILAVGVCIGDAYGNILAKRTWHVAPEPLQQWEPRCVEEFWSKQGDLMQTLSTNQIPSQRFALEFRQLLDSFDVVGKSTLYLVSDNPVTDAGYINAYLDMHGLASMQYGADGRTYLLESGGAYRPVHDSDSYARGVLGSCFHEQWVNDSEDLPSSGVVMPNFAGLVPHQPADDATRIYLTHLAVVRHS